MDIVLTVLVVVDGIVAVVEVVVDNIAAVVFYARPRPYQV